MFFGDISVIMLLFLSRRLSFYFCTILVFNCNYLTVKEEMDKKNVSIYFLISGYELYYMNWAIRSYDQFAAIFLYIFLPLHIVTTLGLYTRLYCIMLLICLCWFYRLSLVSVNHHEGLPLESREVLLQVARVKLYPYKVLFNRLCCVHQTTKGRSALLM